MRVVGQKDIAEFFGVAAKTITEWQEQGFPVLVQGGPGVASEYDSVACVRWLVSREVSKVAAETPKDRLYRLQAERLEMEIAESKKLLIPAAEVEPKIAGAVIAAREFLRGEPARLAVLLDGLGREAREQLLRTSFDEMLSKLASWNRGVGDPEDQDSTSEPADDKATVAREENDG